MSRRMRRLGFLGLALVAVMAVAAAPAAVAKKKKAKTVVVTKTATYNQCVTQSVPIPDLGLGIASHRVTSVPTFRGLPQNGTLTAITNVDVRLGHTFDGDLFLRLVSPGGSVIQLANRRGVSGDGYGTGAGCGGVPTLFSDTATVPIATPGNVGDAPIVGTFKPESPLSGVVGGPAAGTWLLVVSDHEGGDSGTILGFSLNFSYSYQAEEKVKPKKKKKK